MSEHVLARLLRGTVLLLSTAAIVAACGQGRGVPAAATGQLTTATSATTTATVTLPGAGKPPVMLGDMNTPEQFILGGLYEAALTAQGYSVEMTRNVGTPSVRAQAMLQGSLDLYPEYLNIWNSQVVRYHHRFPTLKAAFRAAQHWARPRGLELLTPTPFSDTSGLAVLRSFARAHRLRTLADLRRVSGTLVIGSPLEFSSQRVGLPAVLRAYRFTPASTVPVNIGAQYGALRNGRVGAVYVATTDGQLSQAQYRLLADPRHILGYGNVVPVVSRQAILREGPAMVRAIDQVDALLTQSVMQGLNAEVELGHHQPSLVAREFLQGNGILLPPSWPHAGLTTTTATTATPTGAGGPATGQ